MRTRSQHDRAGAVGDDPISRMNDVLDQAEAGRKRLIKVTLAAVAVLLPVIVVAGVLGGSAMAANRAATPKATQRVALAVPESVEPTSSPGAVAESRTVAPVPESLAPTTRKPSAPVSKPRAKAKVIPRTTVAQRVSVVIGSNGYEPGVVTVAANRPVLLTVGRGEGCAAGFLIPSLKISADNSSGPVTVNLGRLRPGSYQFSCGMEMVTGTLIVK